MQKYPRILFVCLGNICRSPAAENVMRHILVREGLDQNVRIDSAGTIGYHRGAPPDSRMCAAAEARNIKCQGSSRPINSNDFNEYDLIFTMDQSNYEDVIAMCKNKKHEEKVIPFYTLLNHHDDQFIPDPYYGGQDGFDYVIDLLLDGCETILEKYLK